MSASADVVKSGLLEPLGSLGVELESVEVQKAGRRQVVRIVVDRDGGVDLDLIAEVSRRASELLEEPPLADELPGPFVLEVTSPGVDRPLTQARHWRRAVSRLVHVTRRDDSELEGRVVSVPSDTEAVLATHAGDVTVLIADVRRAVVQVEFNRTDPVEVLDVTGEVDSAEDAIDEDAIDDVKEGE